MKNRYLIILLIVVTGCQSNDKYKDSLNDPETFQYAIKSLTDIIVYDIFSPPVASRVYVYPTIAAYQVIQKQNDSTYLDLAGQLKGLDRVPDNKNEKVNYNLAAVHSFFTISRKLIFSEDKLNNAQDKLYDKLRSEGLPRSVMNASFEYGELVANHIMNWANKDNYNQTRTFSKYTIRNETEFWKPTPPDYMDGIEPHWREIRTLVLDSADHFIPKPPLEVSLNSNSEFNNQLMEVYNIVNELNDDQAGIAKFWDCNPYLSHHRGHAMFATKKITPGGHWIGITAIATRKSNSDFAQTINAYTNVSISLFDAFISCWDEKWRSLTVRPETLINEFVDEKWVPLLQTPPFPEYTSGHSVISTAAALSLTKIYGDNFDFVDTTEVEYGLPIRKFNSFIHASEEAAISRLYGGIHYRMAIDEGIIQGRKVGNYINEKLRTIN
ncbi:MAG: vanadium-dependent haloperoxidase [Bacteroidetes bacterium]|jgi:hypothetical protein|nr:vanadium-dependent haloperoxidase [Bacteroidota bacterium]|tara:strand:+ start:138 stop:1454 length:1317 start_codon:yes stop_codon:yes gene_type:complete